MLVIDTSVLVGALLPDEDERDLTALFAQYSGVLAPSLLWVEVRNTLVSVERRGRTSPDFTDRALAAVDALAITLDHMPGSATVLSLARRHQLSAYDALYLELALRQGAVLATLDTRLAAAARAEGVRVVT